MAHQLGLTDYRADIEYNRNGADVIKGYIRHEYHDLVQITCDVILHARGRRFPDNLIAIEMKRDIHPPQYKESDRQRLIALTTAEQKFFDDQGAEIPHVSGYHVGYFLEIQDRERYAIEEYIAGALSRSWVFALER